MKPKYLRVAAISCAAMLALNSCQEHIDEGARFTFVGNTIATYLQSEDVYPQCSHFVEILTRGGELGLMKAYGQYTCFAPTNEAVERYLVEQDSIYRTSSEAHDTIDTGIYSPYLEDLSPEKCKEIARNHILPRMFLGVDLSGSGIPEPNLNGRDLTLDWTDETYAESGIPLINSTAMVLVEEEVENGVVFQVNGVISPSSKNVPSLLSEQSYFSIFQKALDVTGYAKELDKIEDDAYTEGDKITKGIYGSYDAPYPPMRRLGFTIFVETDEVLEGAIKEAGIEINEEMTSKDKWDAFVAYCQKIYPTTMDVWDPTGTVVDKVNHGAELDDWRNPVNQFVGYHLVDRKLSYKNLVCYGIEENNYGIRFMSEKDFPGTSDRTEYYVTMNNRILKVMMPRGTESGTDFGKIFLNYAPNGEGQNIKVYEPNEFKKLDKNGLYSTYNPEARNGAVNVIDKVLVYDEDIMSGKVLNCIMRFDASSLFSELTNNNIRWKITKPLGGFDGETYIPNGYCSRIEMYADATRLYYLSPHDTYHNYQGDEMMALGLFDFAYRLPPLPAGTYEIRMGYSASTYRHVVQVYLDDEVTGLPIDLRLTGASPLVNWKSDKKPASEGGLENDPDLIAANDKDMKNRGYLKGPSTFYDNETGLARHNNLCLRSVIATKYLTAGSHWLRFKNVNDEDDGSAQFMHDYFEIVPMSYLRDESISVEDRRK
ncbi:MAG: fasciclin domain-containing protein [Bacteroidaceae bacterium]|nr:fasciclin domain-containing protein [Bacteroidaceae bacterium]